MKLPHETTINPAHRGLEGHLKRAYSKRVDYVTDEKLTIKWNAVISKGVHGSELSYEMLNCHFQCKNQDGEDFNIEINGFKKEMRLSTPLQIQWVDLDFKDQLILAL